MQWSMKEPRTIWQMYSRRLPTNVSQGLNNLKSDFRVDHHSGVLIGHDLFFPTLRFCHSFAFNLKVDAEVRRLNLFVLNFALTTLAL